ncbi:unnamed protein product [Pleuronectes platessa]|uniref:Uncharacterized protein n=1 Tax=Pleuronectes platessa TaxID=8262 RepID=A0A9N7TZC9_PLEPL|nr:unnamed protein product [Pleuronectes platessa]
MCLVTVLRSAYKQALISGRIYKQQPRKTHDPVPQPSPGGQDFPMDYNNYMRQLQHHEWAMFEVHERHFRRSLDTKQLQACRDESVITNMLGRTDEFLLWSKLEVKHTKCAALYERRSGGNRWYKAKSDKPPTFTLMGQPIRVYSRHETYTYLGHKFIISGEWVMKLEAIREVALAKIQHLFVNVHIPQNVLLDMNNTAVETVRRWLGLNTHSTRDILFLSHKEGGLGVPNVEWTYTTTRLTHLIRMLNNDDAAVRELARASLLLDLRRRKVPLANAGQENFLGFRRKGNGKLDTQAAGYGCRSDWPDLNDLCNRAAVRLKWVKGNSPTAPDASDAVVTDPAVNVEATVYHNGTQETLHNTTARKSLLNIKQAETKLHWTGLRLQGKVACLDFADHSVSHTMYRNASVGEDILCFTVKARLQCISERLQPPHTIFARLLSSSLFSSLNFSSAPLTRGSCYYRGC